MKQKKNNTKTKQLLSVAALLSLQVLPQQVSAQSTVKPSEIKKTEESKANGVHPHIKFAQLAGQKMSLVALLKGEPVFKNGKGELFTMNAATGDIKNVSEEEYARMKFPEKDKVGSIAKTDTHYTIKMKNAVTGITILGTDMDGHLIQETSEGEKFYLDPVSGDIIDWVQEVFILR